MQQTWVSLQLIRKTYGVTRLRPRKPTIGTLEGTTQLQKPDSKRALEIKPGMPTWIDDGDWSAAMRRAFISRRAIWVTQVSQAQVFVVRDVAAPPRLVSFVASVICGLLVSTTLFADPPGAALVYDRALRLERWV